MHKRRAADAPGQQKFPTRIVAFALLAMGLLTCASVLASISVNNKARMLSASQLTVLTRAERLTHLGARLELAAKLAVADGNPDYAEDHRRGRAALRTAIGELREAIQLPGNALAVRKVAEAEAQIFQIEQEALFLATHGRREAAKALLYSPRYTRLEETYSAGIVSIQQRSSSYVDRLRAELERSSFWGRLASLVGIPLILVAWLFIIGPARRWGAALKQARSEAESATQAKSEFLATMSHEMRTPLNSIIGFTDLILEDPLLTEEHKRKIGLVQQSGTALLLVINDLLDFSEIEAGKLKIEAEPFSLEALVGNTMSMIRGQALDKGLVLKEEIAAGLNGFFLGDQHRLRQVLLNLLNNAVKFTDRGTITLSVTPEPTGAGREGIRFTVEDEGPGIPADRHGLLFRKFSQADSSIRRRYGGSGLGLAICKRLVELMAGEIGFSSVDQIGSRFWFAVPLPRCAAPETAAEAAVTAAHDGPSARILLVEDVAANREIGCAMLASLGHVVETATNGAAGVEAARSGGFDLILMDIQMPGMDGMTAARAIRALGGRVGRTPIIALTANVLPRQVREFREAGMDGYVPKPIKKPVLAKAIHNLLSGAEGLPAGRPSSTQPLFDAEVLETLSTLLPPERIDVHLAGLASAVQSIVTASGSDAGLAARAHKLVSQAGTLGFMELSEACSALEEALDGSPCAAMPAVERVKAAALASLPKIAELREAA